MNRNLIGTLFVLLSTAGYAFFPIFTKWAFQAGTTRFDFLVWRFILATVIFWAAYPFWRRQAKLRELTRRDLVILLGLGVIFVGSAGSAVMALGVVPASTYALLVNTTPAVVAIIAYFTGDRLPPIGWVAVVLTMAGVVLTIGGHLEIGKPADILWPMLNVTFVAIYQILAGRYVRHIPGIASGVFVISGALLTMLPIALIHGLHLAPQAGWMPLLGMAFFSTVIGIAALLVGITYIGAARSSLISSAGLPATVFFASLLLGDHMDTLQFIGGGLIFASVILLNLPGSRPKIARAVMNSARKQEDDIR
jgi:drug/metabolite transporter (DMT)-like permease